MFSNILILNFDKSSQIFCQVEGSSTHPSGRRVFKCPHCPFWASTASRFHVHIVGHLNRKPFECSLCAYRSNWRWDITKHIKLKAAKDPVHMTARVLMTDETGRRNYSKYNKYLAQVKAQISLNLNNSFNSAKKRCLSIFIGALIFLDTL